MGTKIKYYIRNIFYSTAILFTSVSVIQIFLGNLGIDSVSVGFFTSLLSVVNVVTSIGISARADSVKNVKKRLSMIAIPIGVCFLPLIPICFISEEYNFTVFLCTAAVCLLQMFFIALYGVFEYKLPYYVIDVSEYGRFQAINGILMGVSNMAASMLLTELLKLYPYRPVMAVCFGFGALCIALSVLFNSLLRETRKVEVKSEAPLGLLQSLGVILRLDSFRKLILPNFLRGVHMGLLNVVAVIAVSKGFSIETTTLLVTVSFLANIVGSLMFTAVSKKPKNRLLCLIGSIVTLFGIMMISDTEIIFLIAYFLTVIGKIIVDYAVPSRVYEIVESDVACLYHTWRLIITTVGTVLSTAVSGFFIENRMIIVFLIGATLCQILSGVCYFIYKSKKEKEDGT